MSKKLVAYFSASGVTKNIAEKLSNVISADLYEIMPKNAYTLDDLNWMNKNSRSSEEMRDKLSRPEVADRDPHIKNYDTIYLGFPIWWYIAPTIINSFLEQYDFSNKKIVLFATSGGSHFGETVRYLKGSVSKSCEIIEGRVFPKDVTTEELKSWAEKY